MVNAFGMQKMNRVYGAMDFRIWNKDTYTYDVVTDTAARNKIGSEMSPYNLVSNDDPPVFIIHGDSDRTVPIYQSRIIVDAFDKAGVKNKLIVKKGGDHRVEDMMPEYGEFVGWFNQWLK
jgi:dipeptidyl aminopeptidase/acylaminoacyl peptidase